MKAEIHEVCCGRCIAIFDLKSKVTIGRNQNAEICSISRWASRDHAFIEEVGRKWFVTDNHSSNGVYVDGKRIEPNVPMHLKNGMEMSLGPTDLTVGRYQFWFSRSFYNPLPKPVKIGRSRNKAPTQCQGVGCKRIDEKPVQQPTSRDTSPDDRLEMLPLRQRVAFIMATDKGVSPYDIDFNNSEIKPDPDSEDDSRALEAPSTSRSDNTPKRKAVKRRRKKSLTSRLEDSEESNQDPPEDEPMITISKQRLEELTKFEEKYKDEVQNREQLIAKTYSDELERNFTCPICACILIKAATLGCGHTFCFKCLDTWKRKTVRCPMCRGIMGYVTKNVVLDNFIESFVNKAGPECVEERRRSIVDQEAIGAFFAETENNDVLSVFDDEAMLDALMTEDELSEAQLVQIIDD